MIKAVILDSTPLGLVTQRPGKSSEVDGCLAWLDSLDRAGIGVYIPEIIDYEIRRELLRLGATASLRRLDRLVLTARYIPLTTFAMRQAAQMWAQARSQGIVTADPQALDGDVILCAQALTIGIAPAEIVVATSNSKHIRHYLQADAWINIQP